MSASKDLKEKAKGLEEAIRLKKEQRASEPARSIDDAPYSTAPGKTGDIQDRKYLTKRVDELEQQLLHETEQRLLQSTVNISLSDIEEEPGRRRKLSDTAFDQLKKNLSNNELVSPITVRRTSSGYQIIAGHNRVQAYRDLGKTSIKAVIQDATDITADVSAFYSNLLSTDLTDFEKFQGFAMLQDRLKLSQVQIAEHSGMSESFVSMLMSFASMPPDALKLLSSSPAILGMDAAYKLSKKLKQSPELSDDVIVALQKLGEGTIDQKEAVSLVGRAPPVAVKAAFRITSGKSTYCDVHRIAKTLRIQFKSAEEAQAIEEAVRELLQRRAEALKSKSSDSEVPKKSKT